MNNFTFYTPTKVVFGKDSENEVGKLVKEQNCRKVLVHYGGQSAISSGLLERVTASLAKENISFVTLGGVVPNPRLSLVYKGISLCKEEGVDFILAVGGGSVIDSAKAIGYGLANDFDVWELYDYQKTAAGCTPVGCILTIAAAGSEMSDSSVITKEEGDIKRGYSSPYGRCRFAIMNPELTYTLPEYQTFSGIADILMHTMERFFVTDETLEMTDSIAVSLLRTVMTNAKVLLENPLDYKARAEIMWAGSLSHNGLTNAGGSGGDWATHMLEHELGGLFDVAHGAGLAAVWGSWARYVYKEKPERFAEFARRVFDIPSSADSSQDAIKGVEAMEAFFRLTKMPVAVKDMGIDLADDQIETMVQKCCVAKQTIGSFKELAADDVRRIYQAAR